LFPTAPTESLVIFTRGKGPLRSVMVPNRDGNGKRFRGFEIPGWCPVQGAFLRDTDHSSRLKQSDNEQGNSGNTNYNSSHRAEPALHFVCLELGILR
jgi:hypothetical protein